MAAHAASRSHRGGRALCVCLTGLALTALIHASALQAQTPAKKLVEYGWDVPDPIYVRDHIRQMEQRPFDGVIFRLRGFNQAFDPEPWPADSLAPQLAALRGIEWDRFTDNFLCLYAANRNGMDWADDAQWRVIAANLRATAAAASAAGCVGICFDPEPYGPDPWLFPEGADDETMAALEAQVRRRGAQFIAALQAELPAVRLLTLYGHSLFGNLAMDADPAHRRQQLAGHHYGLYLAFLEGVLDELAPQARLIDGNERSYYYSDSEAFFRAFHAMRQTHLALVDPANRDTYRLRADAGMALYVDQVLGLRQPEGRYLSHYLDPADQLRWFAHNVYWALRTSDEYVWCYSERMNWWQGDIPDGLEAAVRSAKEKVTGQSAVDFQMGDVLERGRARMEEALSERLVRRSATIAVLAPGVQPPTIDGALTEACWRTEPLQPFVPALDGRALTAQTTARVVADGQALYVAVRCQEPEMDRVVAAGRERDAPLWMGDTIEFFVSLGPEPEPYVHLILNPDNGRWDARSGAGDGDASWDPDWLSAVARQADAWTVEMAIPWAALGGRPEPGATRRVNLCRQRMPVSELSAWSMIVGGFLEPAHFGTWEFGAQR